MIGDDPMTLGSCAAEVRRHDRDRYLTALFASDDRREALFALYAFNIEIAKTREVVSEPALGQIRLQWWREAVDALYQGDPRGHVVVEALAPAVARHGLSRAHFDTLIDARETDLAETPPADLAALEDYAARSSSTLIRLALEVLGVAEDEAAQAAAQHVGIAYALTGLLRAVPHHARMKRQFLPADLMAREGAKLDDLFELRGGAAIAAVVREVAAAARRHLDAGRALRRQVPRAALAALLPATVADAYLRGIERRGYDVFEAPVEISQPRLQLRLLRAAMTGRW
jgi:NADH dehydrogenase [ubiquinone] 1 alpha subcomplex assembly factor 6